MDRATQTYQRLKGPVVPINLCFTESGEVDFVAVCKYADWLCRQDAPVLLLTYGSSEFSWVSDESLYRLTADLAETIAGRSLFITSTLFWEPSTCCRFLKHADKVGADAVKVQMNPWGGQGDSTLFIGYHDRLMDAADIPMLLWCNSGGQGAAPIDAVAELAQRPKFIGVKNDEDPFYYYYDLIRATRDMNFAVMSGGQMRNIVYGYQLGSPAYLCTVAPFRPDIANQFYVLLEAQKFDEAWAMVFRYEERWLSLAVGMDWLLAIKSALYLHGLYPNNLPYPLRPGYDGENLERVRRSLEDVFGEIRKADL